MRKATGLLSSLMTIPVFFAFPFLDYQEPFLLGNSVCCIFWFIIVILLASWVYKDAKSRGMSGGLWVILFLLLGLIGLIIYLVVRKPKQLPQNYYQNLPYQPPAPTQPVYRYNQPQTSTQTVYKEKEIIKEIIKIKCPYCGAIIDQGLDKCPHCGAPLR